MGSPIFFADFRLGQPGNGFDGNVVTYVHLCDVLRHLRRVWGIRVFLTRPTAERPWGNLSPNQRRILARVLMTYRHGGTMWFVDNIDPDRLVIYVAQGEKLNRSTLITPMDWDKIPDRWVRQNDFIVFPTESYGGTSD